MSNDGFQKMFNLNSRIDQISDEKWNDLSKFMLELKKADSSIPAGYTYLAQFIDHDISFDSTNRIFPWDYEQNRVDVTNLRNPFFDLETIYGKSSPNGNDTARAPLFETKARLKLGYTIREGVASKRSFKRAYPNDLPRHPFNLSAQIVDPRNDENFLVAQIQVAFIKFHNAIVSMLGEGDSTSVFEKAKKIAIRHYQYIILRDFLPKIVDKKIIDEVLQGKFVFWHNDFADDTLPFEFSVAAFRFGHAMIRDSYNVNSNFKGSSLSQLMSLTGSGHRILDRSGLPSIWLLNMSSFFDIDGSSQTNKDFNFAKKINTKLSQPLGFLRSASFFNRETSLAALDLYRGRAMQLDSGQSIAQEIAKNINAAKSDPAIPDFKPLETSEISHLLSGCEDFIVKTPLWFYLLAEAELKGKDDKLGEIGGRIVAETFIKLLAKSPYSILSAPLENDEWFLAEDKQTFGMPELLKFIANQKFDELNPLD